jgi:hypothetical protein
VNFACRCFFAYIYGYLTCRRNDMGPAALLPLRRKPCYGIRQSLKIHRPRPGLNPRTLDPVASTVTVPPRTTIFLLLPVSWARVFYPEPVLQGCFYASYVKLARCSFFDSDGISCKGMVGYICWFLC